MDTNIIIQFWFTPSTRVPDFTPEHARAYMQLIGDVSFSDELLETVAHARGGCALNPVTQ